MAKADLRIDWATHEAAKYACENWHYSQSIPAGKLVKVGAWEKGVFIGVVLFAWGVNKDLGSPYGLSMAQCCELVRVALRSHTVPVSRIMSIALRLLRSQSPGLRLVVSYADPSEGHYGGIYQAGGWIYSGQSNPSFEWRLNGKRLHKRSYTGRKPSASVPPGAIKVDTPGKHRYLMPLDEEMRARIVLLAKPYPKRPKQAMVGTTDTAAVQRGPGRSPYMES